MPDLRTHGPPPYTVAVVHGGPGATGSMAPVAERLSARRGVLEPLQTARSVDGQVAELAGVLETRGTPPLTLVGASWGAWLSFMVAARHPLLVKKVVLVGSGPFEESYAGEIAATRLARLAPDARAEVRDLLRQLADAGAAADPQHLARLAGLLDAADEYDPVPSEGSDPLPFQPEIYTAVWPEAAALRASGALLALGRAIRCPVVAIHGAYDPHPAGGVRLPLSRVLPDFRFVLLERCGHEPWRERHARDRFYDLLEHELA